MKHIDKCIQRLAIAILFHIVLLTGWIIVADQFYHVTLLPFLGIFCQIVMLVDSDIKYWKAEYIGMRGVVLIEILPIFLWAGIVVPVFHSEALIFAILQTLYAFRNKWFVDPLTDIKYAANDS